MTQNIQISKKAPDGTIVVVGGDDFNGFYTNAAQLIAAAGGDDNAVQSFIADAASVLATIGAAAPAPAYAQPAAPSPFEQAVQTVQQAFPGAQPVQAAAPPAPQAPARPAGGPPPGQTPPVCEHGYARVWKTGTAASGRGWKAWMCPLSKDEGACEPKWVR